MTGFSVDLPDATLAGEFRRGSGPVPLVLVHGFGGSRHDWDSVVMALGGDTSIVAYDQRGFGQSRASAGIPFSHADDLAALLDELALEQVDVCGLSLGGATALELALDKPERVRRLVLISPMLAGWCWSAEWVELWKEIGRAARAGHLDLARMLWWQHPLFASTRVSSGATTLEQSIAAYSGRQWVQDDQRSQEPMAQRLAEVRASILLLTGGLDVPDFRCMADVLQKTVPNIVRVDDPTAGHLLTLERPRAVATAISDFLGS